MNNNEYDIRLAEVKELRSESSFDYWELLRYKGEKVDVGMTTQVTTDLQRNHLYLKLGVRYNSKNKGLNHEFLHYVVRFCFEIDNLVDKIEVKEEKVLVPVELLRVMLSVGVGTLRGMLIQRTRFTALDKYPLPIFNISHLVSTLCYGSEAMGRYAPLFHFAYE